MGRMRASRLTAPRDYPCLLITIISMTYLVWFRQALFATIQDRIIYTPDILSEETWLELCLSCRIRFKLLLSVFSCMGKNDDSIITSTKNPERSIVQMTYDGGILLYVNIVFLHCTIKRVLPYHNQHDQ